MILLVVSSYLHQNLFTIEPGQIVSFPTGSLYGHMLSIYYNCFVNQSLMEIEMKINEKCSKVLSKVKSQLSYPPLNLKRILKDNYEIWKKLHNGLYGSLPEFAVIDFSEAFDYTK